MRHHRRVPEVRPLSDSVDDVLGEHHQRLGAVLDLLRATPTLDLLDDFEHGLFPHMAWEEQVLFPAARARSTPAQLHSLESLEIDHERLRDALGELRTALKAVDLPAATAALHNVAIYLAGHNADEEHGVYVEVDRNFSVAERRAMLGLFRA